MVCYLYKKLVTVFIIFLDVQVVYEDSKSMLNSDNSANSEPTSQISFDNDTINYEEQLQKQKDLEACFGFKVSFSQIFEMFNHHLLKLFFLNL